MIVKKRVRTFRAWQNVEGSVKPEWVAELKETDDGSILGTMPLHLQLAARQCRRGEWLVEVQPGFVLSMSDVVFHTAYEPAE